MQIHRKVDPRNLTLEGEEVIVAQAVDRERRHGLLPCPRKQPEAQKLDWLGNREPFSFREADTEPHLHLDDSVFMYNRHEPRVAMRRAFPASMAEVERETIDLSKRDPLPEARGVCPRLDAMEGVVNVVANETFLADDGGVVAIKAAEHSFVLKKLFGVWWRGVWSRALDGVRWPRLAGEYCLLGLRRHVQECLKAIPTGCCDDQNGMHGNKLETAYNRVADLCFLGRGGIDEFLITPIKGTTFSSCRRQGGGGKGGGRR